jgi:hypothetical protein
MRDIPFSSLRTVLQPAREVVESKGSGQSLLDAAEALA